MANIKFDEGIAERITRAIIEGATQRAAALKVGVTPESLSIWKKRYPEFGDAVERAHAEAQVFAERTLYQMAAKGNVTALLAWLKNRHPADWGDVQHQEIVVHQTLEDMGGRVKTGQRRGTKTKGERWKRRRQRGAKRDQK